MCRGALIIGKRTQSVSAFVWIPRNSSTGVNNRNFALGMERRPREFVNSNGNTVNTHRFLLVYSYSGVQMTERYVSQSFDD